MSGISGVGIKFPSLLSFTSVEKSALSWRLVAVEVVEIAPESIVIDSLRGVARILEGNTLSTNSDKVKIAVFFSCLCYHFRVDLMLFYNNYYTL